METGNADTPVGNGTLIIKRVNNQEAPNNGVVLEFGYDNNWIGQLYIGDNAHQGIYYNGWSGGVRGSWRRLADEPVSLFDNPSGTNGAVQLSESAANFNYLEIYLGSKCNKIYSPNGKTVGLIDTDSGSTSIYTYQSRCVISGTSITQSNVRRVYWTNASSAMFDTANIKGITKVIGYR